MNKEQLVKLIEETENELKRELENTFIEKRTRIINIEFLLGKRSAFLEILEKIDLEEFCKVAPTNETIKQALFEVSKIYSI
jgi:hypothetical protein